MQNYTLLTTTKPHLHYVEWPLPHVVAFTTTRHSPENKCTLLPNKEIYSHESQSTSPYDFFNLGEHVGDSVKSVVANRSILPKYLVAQQSSPDDVLANQALPKVKIQWLTQVHEADVVDVVVHSDTPYVADAVITRQANLALAVMTADCLPILLVAKDGSEVAAIHGGWRPLAKNIIKNTLMKMTTSPQELYAWLGPCISQKAFEVGHEVKAAFIHQDEVFAKAFIDSTSSERCLADLHEIARLQLMALGVTDISALPHCTYSQQLEYFSYRREGVTGRMASVIMINNK